MQMPAIGGEEVDAFLTPFQLLSWNLNNAQKGYTIVSSLGRKEKVGRLLNEYSDMFGFCSNVACRNWGRLSNILSLIQK
jgi:hypothetical protein